MRSEQHAKTTGGGYQQYDFLIDLIIKHLWLSEMATTNSQSIMCGYCSTDNTAAITTGHTDVVATPSGSEVSNSDGQHAMKYRGIENLWGNIWEWCDGISFDGRKSYISIDPETYEAGKTTGSYIYQGERAIATANDYITKVEPLGRNRLLAYATEASGGSSSTYYCDANLANSGRVLRVRGGWNGGDTVGLWRWYGDYSTTGRSIYVASRLCFKPIDGAELA